MKKPPPVLESGVRFINVDVEIFGASDRASLEKELGEKVVVLRNETVLAFELAGADVPPLDEAVQRLVALVHALPVGARAVWNGATRRVFDIGFQAALDPHSTRWSLEAKLVRDLAAIDVDIAITVYGARAEAASSFPTHGRTDATLFDAYIACDWSASSTPKSGRDSLWLCRARYSADGTLAWELENPRTRQDAIRILRTWLVAGVEANERTLAGFDFSFGLPEIAYAGLKVTDWRGYWECLHAHIVEGPKNENNRFAVARSLNRRAGLPEGGPFWGVPPGAADGQLRATKQAAHDAYPEYRAVETKLRARKLRPFSAWQLLGNGSVGSQALVGIPVLQSLRTDPVLAPHTRVWPFETEPRLVVLAEVWPTLVEVDLARHEVRDAAQMIALASWAATEDRAGRLAGHFASVEPLGRTEGWVLGA